MEIELKNKKFHLIYLSALLIVAVIFSFRECSHKQDVNSLINDITNYSDSAKYYKGKNGEVTAYNKILEVQNEEQLRSVVSTNKQIAEEIKHFKTLRNVTTIKEVINIHDTIRFDNIIPCDFKPFAIRKESEHYKFKGILSNKDLTIDSLTIPNTVSVIVGKRKVGFLKYEDQVNVLNSNPYVMTTNISNVSIKREKKWWERPLVTLGIGFVTGIGVSTAQRITK